MSRGLPSASEVVHPPHSSVANAIGAAVAQVGGEVDRVFAVEGQSRDAVLDIAKREACERAVAAGADKSSVKIVEVEDVPLAYLPGNATRIRAKAVGDLLCNSSRRAHRAEDHATGPARSCGRRGFSRHWGRRRPLYRPPHGAGGDGRRRRGRPTRPDRGAQRRVGHPNGDDGRADCSGREDFRAARKLSPPCAGSKTTSEEKHSPQCRSNAAASTRRSRLSSAR